MMGSGPSSKVGALAVVYIYIIQAASFIAFYYHAAHQTCQNAQLHTHVADLAGCPSPGLPRSLHLGGWDWKREAIESDNVLCLGP